MIKSLLVKGSATFLVVFLMIVLTAGTVLVFSPAAMVLGKLHEYDKRLPVFTDTDGTLLAGKSHISVKGIEGSTHWELSPHSLLARNAMVNFGVNSKLGELSGGIVLGSDDLHLNDINGNLSAAGFNQLIKNFGGSATIDSGFNVSKLDIRRSEGYFYYANGELSWDGGLISFEKNNKAEAKASNQSKAKARWRQRRDMFKNNKAINLPAMRASFDLIDEGIRLTIFEKESNLPFGEIDISDSGIAHFKFFERFGQFIPMLPTQLMHGNPDALMFQVKQTVFSS